MHSSLILHFAFQKRCCTMVQNSLLQREWTNEQTGGLGERMKERAREQMNKQAVNGQTNEREGERGNEKKTSRRAE